MLFTIAIPAYNRLQYLQELVEKCLSQTYPDFEVCISLDQTDNGLNPEIVVYCETMAKSDARIKFYPSDKKLGLAGNWNRLVSLAAGDYIFLPGDDDLITPDFLAKVAAVISKDKEDVIFCNQFYIDSKGNKLIEFTEQQNEIYHRTYLPEGDIPEPVKVVLQNSVPMSSAVIQTHWLRKFPFDEKLNTPELEVFLKIALSGGRFYYINEQLADYRVHLGSATASGLTIDRFVSNIMDIAVPEVYEPDKRNLLAGLMVVGVNRALERKDKDMAKKLFKSSYYHPVLIYHCIHFLLIHLPANISAAVLKSRKKNQ